MRRSASSLVLVLALSACSHAAAPTTFGQGRLTIGTASDVVSLDVQIARTPDARARGLMGRDSLPAYRGMVFLFGAQTLNAFWMKDTTIPLSIAFWDAQHRVVSILDMAPCSADPCPRYAPDGSYVGAVEANRGYFAQHGVQIGDHVELTIFASG